MDSVDIKKIAYEKLTANLDELLKQYRLLLDCVRKEKDFLLLADLDKLNENNLLKEELTIKIKLLDNHRVSFAADLAHAVRSDVAQPRLLDLAQKMGGPEGDRLRNLHSTLEIIIKRLSVLNSGNAIYAQSALTTVSSALENFKEHLMGKKTYQKKGKYIQGAESSGHLVKKEA